ncbi:hypothetical protein [Alkalimarinus sediminis]|uniref:GTPase n=1 Tax=Alkalimarinus sediminis TaxID=1632866 RepID=A0A9E8HPH0_9ALTE|nr:hypothetical protein [Alkalimarinus sediminis]UZW74111.1 hypothetical protein NNL22_13910 [Alkalimarinus sediminis]
MTSQVKNLNLTVPEQSLATLSFCDATPHHVEEWVSSLPMANIGETARQLYHAIIELNQLIISSQIRSQLLELIRPAIQYVCNELSKHYLNQPIILPEKQRKIANLSQALQIHLATGYKVVILENAENPKNEKAKKSLAVACHRVISEYGRTALRSSQLYCPSPKNVWLESHAIFKFAEASDLLKYAIKDERNISKPETTIEEAYKRLLLLGCCKTNQLRQSDLTQIYNAFEVWASYTDIGEYYSSNSTFVLNMESDAPPVYRSLLHDSLTDHFYGFDTSTLVQHLTDFLSSNGRKDQGDDSVIEMPSNIQDQLIAHLAQALGILTKRNFKRMSSKGHLQLCTGLSAAHYFCSGEVEFNTQLIQDVIKRQLASDEENMFLHRSKKQNDAWSGAFDAGPSGGDTEEHASIPVNFTRSIYDEEKHKKPTFKHYNAPLINTSPGGYCLQWLGEIPGNIQAGEILGIRENEAHPWSVAVIRWIRQVKQHGTQIGIELLAPSAQPCGVQLIQKTGENSEYLRGLLLPELSAIGQAATLITPRLPFQTGQKILLNQQGEETKCQLNRRVAATGSFSQFELKIFSGGGIEELPKATKSSSDDDFDSLWPSL